MSVDYRWTIQLVCPEGTHNPIDLPHKTPVVLGRIQQMRIIDPRCSRKQVELTSNCHTGEVIVKQVGPNNCALDGIELIQNKEYKMKPSATLFILTGLYPQKLKIVDNRKSGDSSKSKEEKINELQNGEVSSKVESKKDKERDKSKAARDPDKESKKEKHLKTSKEKDLEKSKHTESVKKQSSNGSSDKIKEDSKSGSKRHSSSDGDNDRHLKKPKLSDSDDQKPAKKVVKFSDKTNDKTDPLNNDDDDKKFSDVSEKLKALKESAKKLKTPEKKTEVASSSNEKGVSKSFWEKIESLYVFRSKDLISRSKIASFDVDGTIITTKSGKVFPTNSGDWRLLYDREIKKKLKKLHEDGFKIVFISNQMGVSRGKAKIEDLQSKFQDIVAEFDFPVQVLLATKSDIYRKPCIGMWQYLGEKGNDGIPVDTSTSFYVGDAAGRPKDWQPKKKKDFSCSDRLFALNLGIKFFTPEEFFVGYPAASFNMPEFDPRKCSSRSQLLHPEDSQLCSDNQEVLILVGSPASGKSWLVNTYLVPQGYCHINRDTLGTWQKCVAEASGALKRGKSVVIDNTNPDVESRARYVEVSKKAGVPCRCFVFTTTHAQAKHNERFREITDKSHQPINDMILNSYKKKYVPPEKKEGFSEIVKVNCVPKFTDSKLEDLYRKFLIDK